MRQLFAFEFCTAVSAISVMSFKKTLDGTQILEILQPLLVSVSGDHKTTAQHPRPPELADSDSVVFIGSQSHKDKLKSKASIIVAKEGFLLEASDAHFVVFVKNTQLAMAKVLEFFDQKTFDFHSSLHPTAVISPKAKLGKDVTVGAFSVIGDYCEIADGCQIGHHVTLSAHSKVGKGTLIHSFVFLGHHCEIGSHCEIFNHTTIGSDGFGYVPGDPNTKIPQVGTVIIEDNVSVGAQCTVNRASIYETRIRKGTKIDDHCHFAHNVDVGENSLIAGGFFIAGSSKTGKNLMVGGTVAVSDHVNITDHVTLGGRSAVTADVREPGAYTGFPLEPIKRGIKNLQAFKFLHEIRMDLKKLKEEHLNSKK
jgi:UDP-3-O-[3-hydroxymyristoyl] glucosamine N-acyltransferase